MMFTAIFARDYMDRAQAFAGPGLGTTDYCKDGEKVSRVGL